MSIIFLAKSLWKSRKGMEFTFQGILVMSLIVIGLILLTIFVAKNMGRSDVIADSTIGTIKNNVGSRG